MQHDCKFCIINYVRVLLNKKYESVKCLKQFMVHELLFLFNSSCINWLTSDRSDPNSSTREVIDHFATAKSVNVKSVVCIIKTKPTYTHTHTFIARIPEVDSGEICESL